MQSKGEASLNPYICLIVADTVVKACMLYSTEAVSNGTNVLYGGNSNTWILGVSSFPCQHCTADIPKLEVTHLPCHQSQSLILIWPLLIRANVRVAIALVLLSKPFPTQSSNVFNIKEDLASAPDKLYIFLDSLLISIIALLKSLYVCDFLSQTVFFGIGTHIECTSGVPITVCLMGNPLTFWHCLLWKAESSGNCLFSDMYSWSELIGKSVGTSRCKTCSKLVCTLGPEIWCVWCHGSAQEIH